MAQWFKTPRADVSTVNRRRKSHSDLPVLETVMSSGLFTLEKVQVLRYGVGRN
jgi:hypothetical protein